MHFCDKVNLGEFWSCMIAAIKAAALVVKIQNWIIYLSIIKMEIFDNIKLAI